MDDHIFTEVHRRIIALLLSFSIVNFTISEIFDIIYTSLAKEYGVYLSLWWIVIISSVTIFIMYPIFVVPVVKTKFRQPLSRRAIISQALGGVFVLPPLTVLTEIIIILLAKLASPLSIIPVVGDIIVKIGNLIPSFALLTLIMTTALAAVLGVWSSLALYWLVQKIRS